MVRALALIAVLATPTGARAVTMELAGSEWGFADRTDRFVQFAADGRLYGSGGCNRFFGAYSQQGDKLAVTGVGVTMMACLDDAVMQRERQFLDALAGAHKIEGSHLTLKLVGEDGAVRLELVRRDFD